MAGKLDFDDTRDAIGVGGLSDAERKNMLKTFQDAGGQVLKEGFKKDPTGSGGDDDKSGKGGGSGKGSLGRGSLGRGTPAGDEADEKSGKGKKKKELTPEELAAKAEEEKKQAIEKAKKKMTGGLAQFVMKVTGVLKGVSPFSGDAASASFLSFLVLELKESLVNLNQAGDDIFLKDQDLGQRIMRHLDDSSPLFLETMSYAHNLHKEINFGPIDSFRAENANGNAPLDVVGDSLKDIYTKLYYLAPFAHSLRKGHTMAIEIFKQLGHAEGKQLARLEIHKKNIQKAYTNIFETGIPKLFSMICLVDKTKYPPNSVYFEKKLNIDQEAKLGKRMPGDETVFGRPSSLHSGEEHIDASGPDGEGAGEGSESAEPAEPENPILATEEYKYGMNLMQIISPPALKRKVDGRNKDGIPKLSDRAYLSYLFFLEYDQEYAFVLTSNQIEYAVDYTGKKRRDIKRELSDLYDQTRGISQNFDKYVAAVKEMMSMKESGGGMSVARTQLEDKSAAHVDAEGRSVRVLIRKFLQEVITELSEMIADMQSGDNKLVLAPDKKVSFNPKIEGKKRLNNKTVKECITDSYCYAVALHERVKNGDLFGGILEMTAEEMTESFGAAFHE